MATIAAIVDYKLPDNAAEDSYNLLPALRSETLLRPIREATVHHSAKGNFAIRQGDWVYIDAASGADRPEPPAVLKALAVNPHREQTELYNLANDPNQTTNVVRDYPDVAEELSSLLAEYRSSSTSLRD